MSRREDRSSDRNRRRSRFDREPSPKRYRRDGKLETERLPTDTELDKGRGHDQKHRRQLQDLLPLEAPLDHSSKFEATAMNKESEDKTNELREGAKHSSDPTRIPQSRSYFQHDDRGSVRQNGRGFSRRTDKERGWWRDSKEQHHGGAEDGMVASDAHRKNNNRGDNHAWRHDGYFEMEANPNPPVRKRPSFREQKISADPDKHDKVTTDSMMPKHKEPARWHSSEPSDRPGRKRELNSRDRYGGGSSRYGGRERFTARQGHRPTGGRVEKWKHDLYSEANRSPTPKNEEDQISKIEDLLAS